MKKLLEILSPEDQEKFKNFYYICNQGLRTFFEKTDAPTVENFGVVILTDKGLVIYTVDDITWFRPERSHDYHFRINEEEWFGRDELPEEVCTFLDEEMKKRMPEVK